MTNYVISGSSDSSFNGTYAYDSTTGGFCNGTYYFGWFSEYSDWMWGTSYGQIPPIYYCTGTGSSPLEITSVNTTSGSYSGAIKVSLAQGITSFSPVYGEGVSVVITGAGLTGATAVLFNGTPAASFVVNSDTQITAVSPASFTAGTISVTLASGILATSSATFYPTAVTAYYDTIMSEPALKNYYPLRETSGSSFSDVKSGRVGTWAGTYTLGKASGTADTLGKSVLLGVASASNTSVSGTVTNGSADFVGGSMTIEGLVKMTQISGLDMPMFGLHNDSNANFYVKLQNNTTTMEWGFRNSAGTVVTLTSTVSSSFFGVWRHVAFVYDASAGTLTGYIDGAMVVTGSASGTITNTTVSFVLATYSSQWFCDGYIEGVATYNAALSSIRILAHKNAMSGVTSLAPANIASFSPIYGQNVSVVILGGGFTGATQVAFNGAPVSFVVNSNSQITAQSPGNFTAGPITVTLASGAVVTSSATFYPICRTATNTTSPSGALLVVTGSAETILPGCDLKIAVSGAAISLAWDVKASQYLSGVVKSGIFRLRRTGLSGAILASSTFGDTNDYTTGDKSEWSSSYSDNAPTDGEYVLTVQSTNSNSSTATYSALRTFSVSEYGNAAFKYRQKSMLSGGFRNQFSGGF